MAVLMSDDLAWRYAWTFRRGEGISSQVLVIAGWGFTSLVITKTFMWIAEVTKALLRLRFREVYCLCEFERLGMLQIIITFPSVSTVRSFRLSSSCLSLLSQWVQGFAWHLHHYLRYLT